MAELIKPGLVFADTAAFTDVVKMVAQATTGVAVLGPHPDVERLLILTEPPQLDAGEITDKGYVNQGITRRRRTALVALLAGDPPHPRIVVRG